MVPYVCSIALHSPRHGEAHVDGDGVSVVERGRAAQLVAGRPGVPEGDRPTLVVLVQVRALQLQHPQHAPVRDLPASLAQARGRALGVPELVPVGGSLCFFIPGQFLNFVPQSKSITDTEDR